MSNPFAPAEEHKEISEVNVVPLADVSLVLLIILLLLSPMMTQSMLHVKTAGRAVEPNTPPPEEVPLQQELVLSVALDPQGLSVGERHFPDPGDFVAFMKGELARRADKKVFLTPHPDVTHGQVVSTLELIKSCGAESVALVQVQEDTNEVRPAEAPQKPN